MAKYYGSEMSMRVANSSMAVLGGSGYMKDYAVERHLRDSRITTIYEGTSQLQVVAAIAGVMGGQTAEIVADILGERTWSPELQPLTAKINDGLNILAEAVAFVKAHNAANAYRDLYARKLVDIATDLVIAALFCDHATASDKKLAVARRWLNERIPRLHMLKEQIYSGDTSTLDDFETLVGPLPKAE